ncbi:MAG: helix-turn-helix domain-containing protein, partial [Bradyrhizobium sp.]
VWQALFESLRRQLSSAAGIGMTVGEIALRSGFSDLSSFGRMFKRRYGVAPREVRRAWLEADDLSPR